jgi:bifunctional non-homologous end joining protein LigD
MDGMADRLEEYRRKRDPRRTSEPIPERPPEPAPPPGGDDTFVIQQHHARSLHWDLRLERDGVLVSWAVPRGLPRDPSRNHLAVHTEDHPMEYADFHGDIPEGEYGAGRMTIYDRGTYETEKWRDGEVIVVLHGDKVSGRYVLFRTSGKGRRGRGPGADEDRDWMIHRMDGPPPGWTPPPEQLVPMIATAGKRLPADDAAWGFEMTWEGARAIGYVSGGRLRLAAPDDSDLTPSYPELRAMGEALAPIECVLDGEIVAFDKQGRVSADALAPRTAATAPAEIRRLTSRIPVLYMIFDLLWLDGESTMELPYRRRRELLAGLDLSGPHWQAPPHFAGGGRHALGASREQGLPGVTAKRLDSPYQPGESSRLWRRIPAGRH